MRDTMNCSKFRLLVFVVTLALLTNVLSLPRNGTLYAAGGANPASSPKAFLAEPPPIAAAVAAPQAITYDLCLQDNSNGSNLALNTTTGAYIFTCGNCVKKTGIGTLIVKGCTVTLQHNPSDRRVLATIDKCARKGTASLQSPPGSTRCTIGDTNLAPESCSTDLTPPQVNLTAPNGGETIDRSSSFTISWIASDDVAVTSQDLLLSTDGGVTFSTIVAGLAGTVNQYAWTVPVGVNHQSARVKIIVRDAACNTTSDASDANFTLWNPPASFTHVAEAPIYTTSGGFDAYIYLCNSAMNPIVAELDFRQPTGGATPNAPAQLALVAGDSRKIRVADYLTLGSSASTVEGSIALRHNGSSDSDVQAMLVVNKFGEEQSFTAPFVYAASSQAPDGTMQSAPICYLDDLMTTSLALQNCKNYPVDVTVKLVYGTGDPAGPNGYYYLPQITLGGQGRLSTDLAVFKDQLQGAKWGSVVIYAPAQSVAAHMVMRSAVKGVAFTSSFVDPRMSTNTTKVASALKLDYDTATKPCVMICNTSTTDTRIVTASFQTDTGVEIPSQQVTLAPGQQKMIVLDPVQHLSPHQSAMADVRLSYSGNASDIVAGGVSMSAAGDYASGARFVEPRASDGRMLMSPFFRIDARTRGVVQISNLGASSIRAGVSMKFANSTAGPVTTDLVSVGAGRTATLDIQQYIEQSPDGLVAEGCLELIHNGVPGTVTGSFISMMPDPIETPLEGAPPMCHMTVFPSEIDTQPGDTTQVYVITCGGQGAVVWSATAGTINPQPSSDPDVFTATYTAPDDGDEPDTATITATGAGGVGTTQVEIQKVKLQSIATSNAQGDTGGRLNPDGGTAFVLTGKKDFPDVPLQVRFQQGDSKVSVNVSRGSTPRELVGTAPSNTVFIGDAEIRVFADNGSTKISKKTLCDDSNCGAYYSFDPPTPPTSVGAPGAFNRSGGNLTITAALGGFRVFQSSTNPNFRINPRINFDGIGFEVNVVTTTTINGNVQKAGPEFRACVRCGQGQQPCKFINVRNPGGRSRDAAHSVVPLYNLLAGPAPSPQSRFPDAGFSIGGTLVTIKGENLDLVDNVTVGGVNAPIISKTDKTLIVSTLPHSASSGGSNPITLFDIDCAAPGGTALPGGGFTYLLTQVTRVPNTSIFIVGPGEGIDMVDNTLTNSPNINCTSELTLTLRSVAPPPSAQTGVQAFLADGSYKYCGCTQVGNISGTISFTLFNTAAPMNNALRRAVNRNVTVSPYSGFGSCNGSF